MSPCAPTRDTASGLKRDSVWMTARIRDGDMPCTVAASWMNGSSVSLSQAGRWKSAVTSTELSGSDDPNMLKAGVSMRRRDLVAADAEGDGGEQPGARSFTRRSCAAPILADCGVRPS